MSTVDLMDFVEVAGETLKMKREKLKFQEELEEELFWAQKSRKPRRCGRAKRDKKRQEVALDECGNGKA